MTQTTGRVFDEIAKLMTDAAGAAHGVRKEVEGLMKAQGERILKDMDVVDREAFEAVKAMTEKARAENDALSVRLDQLTARVAALEDAAAKT